MWILGFFGVPDADFGVPRCRHPYEVPWGGLGVPRADFGVILGGIFGDLGFFGVPDADFGVFWGSRDGFWGP